MTNKCPLVVCAGVGEGVIIPLFYLILFSLISINMQIR